MIQTYVRPLWNKILCIIASYLISNVILFLLLYFMLWGLNGSPNVIAEGTIFGNVPYWFVFLVAFQIFVPLIAGFSIYPLVFKYKYEKEYCKKLIPFYFDNQKQPMIEAKKYKGTEPIWKENYVFEANLKLLSINYFCGKRALAKLYDTNTEIIYYMFATRWAPTWDGTMRGNFSFDTNWYISNIYKVE